MRVIDHEPYIWFLLESGDELVLDVNCSHSFISYSFAIVLNRAEREQFAAQGHDYITRLANEINNSAPVVAESTSSFKSRNVHDRYGELITAAVAEWRGDGN